MNCTVADEYLAIPVSNQAGLTRMHLQLGSMEWLFDIQLTSPERAEYWAYINLRYDKGAALTLQSLSGETEENWSHWIRFCAVLPDASRIYQEPHRPQIHFSSPRGWINDPNGLVRKDGRYHMFYQLNPFGCRGFDKGWGHCVSDNLFDWEVLPPALSADRNGYAISGSTCFDTRNAGGFGENAWIMAYSSRMHMAPEYGQQQNIAYSDDGIHFIKYDGNPVIVDMDCLDFRDPKVFWDERRNYYVMLVTFGSKLRFYKSDNLREWSLLSEVEDADYNPLHDIYECPDLLEYPVPGEDRSIWVLSVSIIRDRSVRFIFGDFDGVTFRRDSLIPIQRADYGKDFYAAVAWNPYGEMRQRKLWIGWMCFWPYSDQCPKTEGWLNLFTVPRELRLQKKEGHFVLCQAPARELEELSETSLCFGTVRLTQEISIPFLDTYSLAGSLEEDVEECVFAFCYESGEKLTVTVNRQRNEVCLSRTECNAFGVGEGFEADQRMPLNSGPSEFRILCDRNAVELYFDSGEHCMSALCYSRTHSGNLRISGEIGTISGLRFVHYRCAKWKF